MTSLPRALILHANGSNRDHDVATALQMAGAQPEIVHLNQLRAGSHRWADYQLLIVPGGFSYADALGAGKLMALDLQHYFADHLQAFVASGKPILGICNGFQVLVKAGVLPFQQPQQTRATLTFNASGHFECRWVQLQPSSKTCLWTANLAGPIECPVAHGEGRFTLANPDELTSLQQNDQIAFTYISPAPGQYPANPNGSLADIAGVCNPTGNVLGLMPHPENHIYDWQHPRYSHRKNRGLGLAVFQQGVAYAQQFTATHPNP